MAYVCLYLLAGIVTLELLREPGQKIPWTGVLRVMLLWWVALIGMLWNWMMDGVEGVEDE